MYSLPKHGLKHLLLSRAMCLAADNRSHQLHRRWPGEHMLSLIICKKAYPKSTAAMLCTTKTTRSHTAYSIMEKNKLKKTNYMYVLVVFKKERHKRTHNPNKSRSLWAANLLYTQTSHTYTHIHTPSEIPSFLALGFWDAAPHNLLARAI